MQTERPSLLLYDGDCRICTAFARIAAWAAGGRALRARAIQDSSNLLAGIAEETVMSAAHVVSPDGRVRTGPAILPVIAGAVLHAPRIENRLNASPRARAAAERTYELLVVLRGGLTCASGAPLSGVRTPR